MGKINIEQVRRVALFVGPGLFVLWLILVFFFGDDPTRIDLSIYQRCRMQLLGDLPVYGEPWFRTYCLYPPAFYYALAPVADTGSKAAGYAWLILTSSSVVFCLLGPVLVIGRDKARPSAIPLVVLLLAVLLWGDPARVCVKTGNVQPLVTALMIATMLLTLRGPRWCGWVAGVCLGLAVSIKLFAGILAVYLLGRGLASRSTRMRDAGAVALVVFGCAQFAPGSGEFWSFAVDPGGLLTVGWIGSSNSLSSLLYLVGIKVSNLWVMGLVLAAVAVRFIRRRRHFVIEYSELLLCILLISPVTWAHYYLMATPALVLAALCVYRRLQRADAGGARLPGGNLVELVGLVFCCVIFFLADRYNDGSHRLLSALGVVLSCTAPLVLARLMRGAGVWLAQEPDRPEPI